MLKKNKKALYPRPWVLWLIGATALAALVFSIAAIALATKQQTQPTPAPTATPTPTPTAAPTSPVTQAPTALPTSAPTAAPLAPTAAPIAAPPVDGPPFNATRFIIVNKGGDDGTCDGSDELPCLTVMHAMGLIQDASVAKRYAILVGPGSYMENVALKANVMIVGSSLVTTRLLLVDVNDASWLGPGDLRSGLKDLSVLTTMTANFAQNGASEGKLYHFQVRFNGVFNFSACNSINQILNYNVEFIGAIYQQGGNLVLYASVCYGAISIQDQTNDVNPVPGQHVATQFYGTGGGGVVPLAISVANDIPSPAIHPIDVLFNGFTNSATRRRAGAPSA